VPKKNCHPDKKVTTSQDDGFVGVVMKNSLNRLTLIGRQSWLASGVSAELNSERWFSRRLFKPWDFSRPALKRMIKFNSFPER
jgi:hypothetical protein